MATTAKLEACFHCGGEIPSHHVRISYQTVDSNEQPIWVSICMGCEDEVRQTYEPLPGEC